MTTLLSLSILLAVALSSEGAKYHYHRYMLSDYRPQHRHGLQRDYKPVTRYPHFATETTAAPGELTVNVKPNGSRPKTNNTVNVDKLMMRVIDGRKKYCMGIPKSSRVLVMTTSCALNLVSGPTTIRTSEGKTIAVNITAVTNYFMYSLTEIHVDQPLINDTEIPATCTNRLQPENIAQVSVYGLLMLVGQQSELRADDLPAEDKARYKAIKMKYKWNDWRPHFGYNPAHWSINHRRSRPSRTKRTDLRKYMVTLRYNDKVFCSGIVVNNQTVLTVKSCLLNKQLPKIYLYFSDGTAQIASTVSNSTDYTISSGAHLLALLNLPKALGQEFKTPPPICMEPVKPKDKVVQLSWDRTYSRALKKFVPQVPVDQCQELNNDPNGTKVIAPAMNCVENTQHTDKCEETFGLPYAWKGAFCGMNIMGHNCPTASTADVYVRLLREKRLVRNILRTVAASNLDEQII
ncbi:hypothetical protein AWZ03_003527 [Drosophila navojoa]|uniref:Peptidase S1 domain-containing protein n=1 Tax=Drosophila navojoa TaxID=7232 RepID=A0A484BMK8_DRONA|nr:hypothetical protein AWZ03_003527 [Drosophila navojoa]